jgi:hypothetical protein
VERIYTLPFLPALLLTGEDKVGLPEKFRENFVQTYTLAPGVAVIHERDTHARRLASV